MTKAGVLISKIFIWSILAVFLIGYISISYHTVGIVSDYLITILGKILSVTITTALLSGFFILWLLTPIQERYNKLLAKIGNGNNVLISAIIYYLIKGILYGTVLYICSIFFVIIFSYKPRFMAIYLIVFFVTAFGCAIIYDLRNKKIKDKEKE